MNRWKQLAEMLQKIMAFVTPDLKQIISDAVADGKEWTREKVEAVLDKLEDGAAQTATNIDNAAVQMVREIFNLPDLPDNPEPTPADGAEAEKTG